MKFQHHATSHGNALTRPHAAPPEGQIRQGSFDDDAPAWIVDGTNLCRVLDGNTFIIAARIGHELAEEGGEAMGTELTAKGIDGQGAEEPISDPIAWREFGLPCPAFWAWAGEHGRSGLLC